MKKLYILAAAIVLMALSAISANAQLKGNIFIHDPSTIAECDGKYYTFGTGSGGLISEDGYTWTGGGVRTGGGVAPDVIKIGDRYLVSYSAGFPGTEGKTRGNIITMWTKTLDPESPDFGYSDPMLVAWAEADEDCWAIDPAFLMGPDGKLWCSYGTYFGTIRICELDPKTGNRMPGDVATDIAIDCEATALMYRNGWYYLLATHGTCCDGVNSTYNIVVGRSRNPRGPYYDNVGRDMMEGGGRMVLSAGNRVTGPGHFGHFVVDEGVERMSCHYEADMDLSGRSVLAINALQWRDDWPFVADQFKPGTFEIESVRRGYALEIAVDFVRMAGRSTRGFGSVNDPTFAIENQKLVDVIADWPKGEIGVRANDYMFRPHQRWTITPVEDAGGYLGFPYYKIEIEGTHRALAATEAEELVTVPAFTGADEQLWRIEQLIDGSYRIMPKSVPGHDEPLALICTGDSTVALGKYDFNSDNSKWNFRDR
ncbi:MAG: family 43 glycosylhydrolase [Bacteroidales bacterium]|nr:family 43 glycosylhydrolase [Bacteroidales bacterium]MBQ3984059.1 family 43 glycosylhydrolase [Bacteroidales bacterium]MBQ4168449.1 family 43 glycosylhydrolase [Bacteroidales bacterium]MBQ5416942.1 family 43 glycosylhydrolase [Bacteroidales bacterium]MBQ7072378.1 family 43 glycosylhydrolase [Bacteroidales bacterium]